MIGLLIVIISPVLMCPVMLILSRLTPWRGFREATVRRHGRRYITLHLNTFDRIGHLSPDRARGFHLSFLRTLEGALVQSDRPVYLLSHLLRPPHRRSLRAMMRRRFPERRWRCRQIQQRRSVRIAIQLQALLQEWRWISVPKTAWLVVVRPASETTQGTPTSICSGSSTR